MGRYRVEFSYRDMGEECSYETVVDARSERVALDTAETELWDKTDAMHYTATVTTIQQGDG